MKSFLTGIVLLLNSLAFAQDLNFQDYKRFLMSGSQTNGKKLALQTSCTNAAGKSYRIGDKGYDACLNATKNKDDKNPTIHIGN